MESRLESRLVHVDIAEKSHGLFVATSSDLKGLLVAETSLEDLISAIPDAICGLYAVCGETVVALPVGESDGSVRSWFKVPADMVRSALDAAMERCADLNVTTDRLHPESA